MSVGHQPRIGELWLWRQKRTAGRHWVMIIVTEDFVSHGGGTRGIKLAGSNEVDNMTSSRWSTNDPAAFNDWTRLSGVA